MFQVMLKRGLLAALTLSVGLFFTGSALAEHGLKNDRPNCDTLCHGTSSRAGALVVGTKLIAKDLRMVEILQAPSPWSGGALPCAYCHQDATGIRTNMTGIKTEFDNSTLSKHPSPALRSVGDVAGQLDCVDCHTNVAYVANGDYLNPNIHGVNAGLVGWTGAVGLNVNATMWAKHWNTGNNLLCANYCHGSGKADTLGEPFPSASRAHSFDHLVSIEGYGTAFTTRIRGCLDDGSAQRGCHASHGVDNNTGLVALKWGSNVAYGGTYARPQDCGVCHTFDDPPSNRAASSYFQDGHGKLTANNIKCASCHDSSLPHFTSAGASAGNRLQFVEDTATSSLSSPPKSEYSICLSSGCHLGYTSHSGVLNIGCLDCHDPHGYGVGANLSMMRTTLPVSSPTQNLYFQTASAYWNSSFFNTPNAFSGWLCDNADCHAIAKGGPGPISNLMNPITTDYGTAKHSGGTGIKKDCAGCHRHNDAVGSWHASSSCSECHGSPPFLNVARGPSGYAATGTWSYQDSASAYFKDESRTPHAKHAQYYGNDTNGCKVCHLKLTDSTYHLDRTAATSFRNVIFDPARNPNVGAINGTVKRSRAYSVTATVPNSCLNLYCHSDGQTINRYSTLPAADMAWDAVTPNDPTCEGCHGGVSGDSRGTSMFGAPDYPNPGAGDKVAAAGSSNLVANVKSNSHYVSTRHGKYACMVCHQLTVTAGPNPANGWTLAVSVGGPHANGLRDVSFLASAAGAGAAWNSANLTCSSVICHSQGQASRDPNLSAAANRVATFETPTWGATLTCNSCHLGDKTLATGSHAVHLNSGVWPQGVTLACPDCHTYASSSQHVDGTVQFSLAGSVVPLSRTKVCDGCHGGTAAAATAKTFWYNPGYGNYADGGVTCESCHGGAANLSSILGSTAGKVTTSFTTRGHGSAVDLPWTDADTSIPNQSCLSCHGWKDKHIQAADSYNRPANTLDGAAFTSTNVQTWCERCHDGAPGRAATTHHNGAGKREAAFTMRCDACHNPHGSANIFMVATTVTNTDAVMDTQHAVSFLNTHAYHAVATSGTAICKVCHIDPSTTTAYNKGGEASAIHADYRDKSCIGCHSHDNPSDGGFMASCTGCHGSGNLIWPQGPGKAGSTALYPKRKGGHQLHIDALEAKLNIANATAYGVWSTNTASQLRMCRYCHYGVPGESGHDANGASNSAANVGSINPIWDATNPPTVLDAGGAAVFNSLAANKTCAEFDCHYDKTGGAQTTPSWYNTAAKATCGYCHPYDAVTYPTSSSGAFTLPNAHVKHVDETVDLGYDYTCKLCHGASANYADYHANGNAKGSIAFTSFAATLVSGSVAATYNSNTKVCSNAYCHGNAGLPDWNAGLTVACGSCHGDANGRPDGTNEPSGGSHLTNSHQTVCVRCHISDNTDRVNHAHGPYNTVATAQLRTATGGSITSFSYGAAQSGSSPDPDGYKYTHSSCTPTCHAQLDWGGSGGCTLCHGGSGLYWPQGSGKAGSTANWPDRKGNHAVHIDALEAKLTIAGATAYGTWSTSDADQKRMCRYCHYGVPGATGHDANGATNYAANVGSINPIWDATNPPTVLDANGAAVYNSNAAKTCAEFDCHYDKTGSTQTTPSWYNTAVQTTCAYCHPYDAVTYPTSSSGAFTLPNAHAKHVDETADLGYDYTCSLCHSKVSLATYTDYHANGNAKGSIAFTNFAATLVSGSVAATYNSNTKVCSNAYCHGNAGLPDWNAGLTVACGSCHGANGTGRPDGTNEPGGGNHLTTSHQVGCLECHVNDNTDRTKHAHGPRSANSTAAVSASGTSINTFAYGTTVAASSPDPDGYKYTRNTCTPSCHGVGQWGGAGGCDFCHGYPPVTRHAPDVRAVAHSKTGQTPADLTGNHQDCQYCHGVKDDGTGKPAILNPLTMDGTSIYTYSWSVDHRDKKTTLNGANDAISGNDCGYFSTSRWCATSGCHGADTTHALDTTGAPSRAVSLQRRDLGKGKCVSCHSSPAGSAKVGWSVGNMSAHLKTVRGGTTAGGNCEYCHTGHTGGLFNVRPNSKVGLAFTISLGNASGAKGTTEAEICWRCHNKTNHTGGRISEWGGNSDTNGGRYNYNLGYVTKGGNTATVSNWVMWNASASTAQAFTWHSAYSSVAAGQGLPTHFAYKSAKIRSTHSANASSVNHPGIDRPQYIRCSWCHDVHNTIGPSDKPYLRGSWQGNPYREDGAPRDTITYTNVNYLGAVPRGARNMSQIGGWQIDQNNFASGAGTSPTTGWTFQSYGALCAKCHENGTINGQWDASEVGSINMFGTPTEAWIGTTAVTGGANGHGGVLRGDTARRRASAIFSDRQRRLPATGVGTTFSAASAGYPNIWYKQSTVVNRGYGFRSGTFEPDGYNLQPYISSTYAYRAFNLGATVGTTSRIIDRTYHQFSCSKCHNPHASRLPRLMITNCLQAAKNTWDTKAGVSLLPAAGTMNVNNNASITNENANVPLSVGTSAGNCHRKSDPAYANSTALGKGWNKVTPW